MSVWEGLEAELKNHGVKVRKVSGWKTRGSSSFYPRGIIFHHTASAATSGNAPCLGICTHGRSDLPGPLCNFLVGRDGTVYFIAKGKANHAGTGGPIKGIPRDSGNTYLFGVECENNGLGERWPEGQKKAIATLYAVLLKRMKRGPRMVIGHKEYAPTRKIDPAGIEMKVFRKRVRKVMRNLKGKGK